MYSRHGLPITPKWTQTLQIPEHSDQTPSVTSIVQAAWIQAGSDALTLASLSYKLKTMKSPLKTLNKDNFSDIQRRARVTNNFLIVVQAQTLNASSPTLYQQERDIRDQLYYLKHIEEAYFRQRSRINWLKEGESEHYYFYRVTESRNSQELYQILHH